jgi:hypothetical protein
MIAILFNFVEAVNFLFSFGFMKFVGNLNVLLSIIYE